MSPIEVYVVGVVHIGALVATAYWWFYRRSPWRTYVTGRPLMWKARTIAALFDLAVVGFWWPFPGYDYIYAGVVTAVVVALAYQLRVLRRLQRGPDRQF